MSESNHGNGNTGLQRQAGRMEGPGPQPEAFARVEPEPAAPPAPRRGLLKRKGVLLILAVLIIGGTVAGLIWWLNARQYETTDDAFIEADVTQVSPRVAGHVLAVHVDDNQTVAKGDDAVDLDPADFDAKVAEAQASLLAAQKGLQQAKDSAAGARASVGQARADETAAQTEAERAHDEQHRFEQLSAQAVTQQQLINLRAASAAADARLAAAKQKTISAQAMVQSADSQIQVAAAQVEQAQAVLNEAALQRSYTTIRTPIAGAVTSKAVQVGDYVQPGQSLFALVPRTVYVIANFKETQLENMRPGQDVDVTVDAYPGHVFHGRVDSIQRGSGAAFSLLPPENATGNYVKVVQRVPVKITLPATDDYVLGPGMSAVPKVKVR